MLAKHDTDSCRNTNHKDGTSLAKHDTDSWRNTNHKDGTPDDSPEGAHEGDDELVTDFNVLSVAHCHLRAKKL